jgi:DNA-binding cell septation regulator SpoVG
MDVTDVGIILREDGPLRAIAEVTFDGELIVRRVLIVNRPRGLIVGWPQESMGDGCFMPIVALPEAAARHRFESAVLLAYEETIRRQGSSGPDV